MSGTFVDLIATNFDSQHWVDFDTADGRKAYTLTGVALTTFKGGETGEGWLRQDLMFDVAIPDLPQGKGLKLVHWAPFVTLNAIANDQLANNAGWAVDGFEVESPQQVMRSVRIRCKLAVRDIDGFILRVGYSIALLGSLEDMPHI